MSVLQIFPQIDIIKDLNTGYLGVTQGYHYLTDSQLTLTEWDICRHFVTQKSQDHFFL